MPDEFPVPPTDVLQPEYGLRETHPRVHADERTEPWLIAVSDYLADSRLRFSGPDGRSYSGIAMLRAFIYQRLVGLSGHDALASHLRARPPVAENLGFAEGVPNRDTFRDWWTNRLTDGERDDITDLTDAYCREVGGHLLDIGLPAGRGFLYEPEPHDPEPKRITGGQKKEAIRHIRPLIYESIDFQRADNASYPRQQILDLQAEVSREQDYLQKTVDEYRDFGEDVPWPRTCFNAIQNRSADDWEAVFEEVYDRQLEAAKGTGMLDRPVDVYIDDTIRPFYEREAGLPEGVRGGEPKNGTYYGYHHTTISAQCGGRSILLASFQYTPDDTPTEAVKYLIREAEKHISINEVHMDSAFRKAEMLKWLDDRGLQFTVSYPKMGKRIKLALARMSGTFDVAEDYYVESSDKQTKLDGLTVVAEPNYDNVDGSFDFENNATFGQSGLDDFGGGMDVGSMPLDDVDPRLWKGRRAYLTNKDVSSDGAQAAIGLYKRRWTIETKYRVIKEEFLGKTTSRDFATRTFYWLFAAMLYNAWVLLDVFLRKDNPDLAPDDRPVMPARSFARRFFETDYG